MPSVILPNLMFEEELSGQSVGSGTATRRVAELAPLCGFLRKSPDDVVVTAPDGLPTDLPVGLDRARYHSISELTGGEFIGMELRPWGWSEPAVAFAKKHQLLCNGPPVSSVRTVNSRRFLADFDLYGPESDKVAAEQIDLVTSDRQKVSDQPTLKQQQHRLWFSAICESLTDVRNALENVNFRKLSGGNWVIKSEYSQAARNRICGMGPLRERDEHWLRSRFDGGYIVAVEPWVKRISECGLQYSIHTDRQTITFDGAVELYTTFRGQYLGSGISPDAAEHWKGSIEHGFTLAAAAARVGYFGCLGIDTMRFEDCDGNRFVRFSHDLNARITMGRLACGIAAHPEYPESGIWCHFPTEMLSGEDFSFSQKLPGSVRISRTSPRMVGGRPVGVSSGFISSSDWWDLRDAIKIMTAEIQAGAGQRDREVM